MLRVDVSKWEWHNLVKRDKRFATRGGLVTEKTPTAGTAFVASFSCKSPQTSEVFYYVFEQDAQGLVVLRVYTEEWLQLFTFSLGMLDVDPIVTWAKQNNQGMIGSPSFSSPLYFYVGGGVIQMRKIQSINPSTFTLEPPRGIVFSFGDRFIGCQGANWYANDPGVEPRSFVAANGAALPGSIFDAFQGGDGSALFFTSDGLFSMPADALGQGQSVIGFIAKIPGFETVRPRNAAVSNGITAVLRRDKIVTLDNEVLADAGYTGRRVYAPDVTVDDLRRVGELHATDRGFIVGFRGARGYFLEIDLLEGTSSYVSNSSASFNVVGTLTGRDGETLIVMRDRVVRQIGNVDYTGSIVGVAAGRAKMKGGPVVRRVTGAAANAGEALAVSVNGVGRSKTTPTKRDDTIVGTSTWSATLPFRGRELRTVRMGFNERASEPGIELAVTGGNRDFSEALEVELSGQGADRKDRS